MGYHNKTCDHGINCPCGDLGWRDAMVTIGFYAFIVAIGVFIGWFIWG